MSKVRILLPVAFVAIVLLSLNVVGVACAAGPSVVASVGPATIKSGTDTTISYTLSNTTGANVLIMVNNSSGGTVWMQYLTSQAVGTHLVIWDGRDNDGNTAPDGQYTVNIAIDNGTLTGFGRPAGVKVDGEGNIYVAVTDKNAVDVFSRNGTLINTFTGFNNPEGIAVNSSGYLFVVNSNSNDVKIIAPDGTLKNTLTGFSNPWAVALNSTGYIYVTNGKLAGLSFVGWVDVFAPDGTKINTLTGFSTASDVAVNNSDYIYVTDHWNYVMDVFAPDGTKINTLTGFSNLDNIAVDSNDDLYVVDSYRIKILAPNGTLVNKLAGTLFFSFITVDNCNNVYSANIDQMDIIYGGRLSAGAGSVTVDNTAPAVSCNLTGSPVNSWYNADISVTLAASDQGSGVDSLQYSFDNLSWQAYNSPFAVSSEGNTTVYWNCSDKAGNLVYGNKTIKIDKSAGLVSYTVSGGRSFYGLLTTSATIDFAPTIRAGLTNIQYSLNGGSSWSKYTGPFIVPYGDEAAEYKVLDAYGNTLTGNIPLDFYTFNSVVTPTPTLVPTPTLTPSPTLVPTPSPTPMPSHAVSSSPVPSPTQGAGNGFPWWLVAIGIVVIGIAGVAYFFVFRK